MKRLLQALKVSVALGIVSLVGCHALMDTARVVAKPALVTLVSSLVKGHDDWQTAIIAITHILGESISAQPEQIPEDTEQIIYEYLMSNNVGTQDERDEVMEEVRRALYSDADSYASSGESRSRIVLQSFQKALQNNK